MPLFKITANDTYFINATDKDEARRILAEQSEWFSTRRTSVAEELTEDAARSIAVAVHPDEPSDPEPADCTVADLAPGCWVSNEPQ